MLMVSFYLFLFCSFFRVSHSTLISGWTGAVDVLDLEARRGAFRGKRPALAVSPHRSPKPRSISIEEARPDVDLSANGVGYDQSDHLGRDHPGDEV